MQDLALMLVINISLWLLSVLVGKCWPVDFIWSSWPGLMAGMILVRSPLKFVSPKQWLFFALLWFWGLRLTINFISRGGVGHEDWRYSEMRKMVGPKLFPLLSLPMVFLGQSFFNFCGCASIYGMLRNGFSIVTARDLIGLFICVTAVVIETAADEQLDTFTRKRPEGKQVLDTGLWSWSRHPNYFGELSFWWGLWVCGGCELGPSFAGPFLMTLLFFVISVPLMEDRQLTRKGKLYYDYQSAVPSALIPLPPFIARALCFKQKPYVGFDAEPTVTSPSPAPTTLPTKTPTPAKKETKKKI